MDNRRNAVFTKFSYNIENQANICKLCNTELKSSHPENLMRHLKRKHPQHFEEIDIKRKQKKAKTTDIQQSSLHSFISVSVKETINIKTSADTLINACVEMVTKNGRPLAAIEDSGFRKIIDPILNALKNKTTINRHNIVDEINKKAKILIEDIKLMVKDTIISLKVDSASRLDRSILGLNAQFIHNAKIIVKTLAMIELKEKHTSDYIVQQILNTLDKYDISSNNIYSFTSDNGANMVKAGNVLANFQCTANNLEPEVDDDYDNEDDLVDNYNENELLNNNNNYLTNELLDNIDIEIGHISDSGFVNSIRCAEHTLQLAIMDFLKIFESKRNILKKSAAVVKKLRNPSILALIKKENLNKPILHCVTRWDSTYKMLNRLLNLKDFCTNLHDSIPQLKLSSTDWISIQNLVNILEPAHEATASLQQQQISMSDFFQIWTKCKIKVQKMNTTSSKIFEKCLEDRSTVILESNPLISCMYLDPRYQMLLSNPQKAKAKLHILKIHEYINRNKNMAEKVNQSEHELNNIVCVSTSEEEDDDIEKLLKEKEKTLGPNFDKVADQINDNQKQIKHNIEAFDNIKRLPKTENPLLFWENRKNIDPDLYKIAKIVFAVPPTQVSVERAFSALKFIMADNRERLGEDVLENILLLKLNC